MSTLVLVATVLIGMFSISSAYTFYVGGSDGWVQNPKESYSRWAGRMRFQVHDKLVFKYKNTGDSVLVVKKEDFDSCNVSSPIEKLELGVGGDSVFEFNRTGPFYFISGVKSNCEQGEKLVVIVLAERNKKLNPTSPPTPSPSPSSGSQPPSSGNIGNGGNSPSPKSSSSSSSTTVSSVIIWGLVAMVLGRTILG